MLRVEYWVVLLALGHLCHSKHLEKKHTEQSENVPEKPVIYCNLPNVGVGVRFQRNREGNRVFFTCEPGHKLYGQNYAVCEEGEWSSRPPICIARGCSPVYHVENGRVSLGYGGALIQIECDAPYRLSGNGLLMCDGRKWNGTIPSCDDPLASKTTFKLSSKTHNDWLDDADYSCIQMKKTVPPPKLENALGSTKWAVSEGLPRLYTTYRCRWGFVNKGVSKTLYCHNGRWIGGLPKCIPAEVTASPAVPSLQSDWGKMTHEDWLEIADYTCMGSSATPQRIPPDPVSNGHYELSYAVIHGMPRLYALLQCNHGYRNMGRYMYMYCRDRSWVGKEPRCVQGYEAGETDDLTSCGEHNGGCAHSCTDGRGQVTCSCKEGYRLGSDGKDCVDVDECSSFNGGCEQICRNNDGSYDCHCFVGFILDANKKSCTKDESSKQSDIVPPLALFHQ